ncbi:unnamed protein product [Protopolystoma xenopodis]|uniref:Uncharacterized protein n=1 Tax=Protopolystoma xenopodis TaxID=117903 RepID=A0A448X8M0_9PLAT|nr:unnamed protein product [Protopolystoma xenopodis]
MKKRHVSSRVLQSASSNAGSQLGLGTLPHSGMSLHVRKARSDPPTCPARREMEEESTEVKQPFRSFSSPPSSPTKSLPLLQIRYNH